ncbi:putative agmatinase [Wallemia mellicola]|uniref:Agmatinase n=1 Tax=Wallemia mellicola TaxID=1708541 RepID=A0A4T0TUD2_9BASI|nr:putative agmatinase [Wallemia mellicola]TIC06163.1 putative agmatinase [Wallemia mellicola]TIC13476.1 putative agmatinase [Wallemia mellicola]TIC24331.1 putative agmatinase [Wallemia mellicola]TIC36124.1 putative agmatinase [Wallemia mellicola]
MKAVLSLLAVGASVQFTVAKEPWDNFKHIKAPLFADIVSFAHLKHQHCLLDKSEKFDIAVNGLPLDTSVSYRTGARFGPSGIRQGSRRQDPENAWSHYWKQNPYKRGIKVIDCGDVPVIAVDNNMAYKSIEAAHDTLLNRQPASKQLKHPMLLTFGGDHSVELPILRSLKKVYGPIALIQIDSHIDTWSSGKKYGFSDNHNEAPVSHGNMLWHAHEEGLLSSSIQAGIRTRFTNELDIEDNENFGIEMLTIDAVDEMGTKGISERIKERIGDKPAYITFDIDSLDPAFAPATGTPEPGGLTTREAKAILRGLEGLNLVGADIVEVSPAYDTSAELTQMVAAEVAYELLNLLTTSPLMKTSVHHDEL